MGFQKQFGIVYEKFKNDGVRAGLRAASHSALFGLYHNSPISYGTPIFGREWDTLIILDACRPDALQEVTNDFEFLPDDVNSEYSVASSSKTWMTRNFASEYEDEIARTAYVTGNPFSESHLERDSFAYLDEVWRYAWDDDVGSIAADHITDRAIAAGRKRSADRLIVHYMQPHFPNYTDPIGPGMDIDTWGKEWDSLWDKLKAKEISRELVWDSYVDNLRYVLESVEILLRNLDAEQVVLSADHGNLFGEWGLYGHPTNKPIPDLRRVPWTTLNAEDMKTYTPQLEATVQTESSDVERRLQDLGYKT